jgi:hypothetical protein
VNPGGKLCKCLKNGYWANALMVQYQQLTALIAAVGICIAAAPVDGQPAQHAPVITCINPASGATWQIDIDYDHSTVDSYPAQVSDAVISWHDVKDGGHYTLDRNSGNLTVIVASSTGGYFLHDHCRLPP